VAKVIVAFVDDLMFLSRIREAAHALDVEVRAMRQIVDLVEACRNKPSAVLVDLDSSRLPVNDALAALQADPELAQVPVIGFFSHVHGARAREARERGVSRVLPRSAFVQELPALLRPDTREGAA
jgi:CheY-like chemotaxis protein